MDEADRLPNLHGLTATMRQIAPEAATNKFPGQMELQEAITLTEDQSFIGGQGTRSRSGGGIALLM